eukprot:CAMPEP_0194031918 /NCGR_PEP_ID=MMETSP0009_2-20130614/4974_1 /TAXON_ID=210454 /ORGANISM="Grammatophora oceanica, Strain CCMP 410" /LENGTH=353 /DNA_ID=CAMNT_0038672189 /DNA_START=220 /DNA_END=1281 /DNA_ORIENTATION=+
MFSTCAAAAITTVVALLLVGSAQANPQGPGGCSEGTAVAGSHLTGTPGSRNGLSNGPYELLIDGEALDSSTPFAIAVGVSHSIELKVVGGSAFFRGFLLRLGGGPDSLDKSEYLTSEAANVQNLFSCTTALVGSLAHMENGDKTSISGNLTIPEEEVDVEQFKLEVTVVQENLPADGVSVYYEETFLLEPFEVTAAPTTLEPSSAPSAMPSGPDTVAPTGSLVPSSMPSMENITTASPTTSLAPITTTATPTTTNMPSDSPGPSMSPSTLEPGSMAPSEMPSMAPSESLVPSEVPSEMTPFPTPRGTPNPTPSTPFPTPAPTSSPSAVSSAVAIQLALHCAMVALLLGVAFVV